METNPHLARTNNRPSACIYGSFCLESISWTDNRRLQAPSTKAHRLGALVLLGPHSFEEVARPLADTHPHPLQNAIGMYLKAMSKDTFLFPIQVDSLCLRKLEGASQEAQVAVRQLSAWATILILVDYVGIQCRHLWQWESASWDNLALSNTIPACKVANADAWSTESLRLARPFGSPWPKAKLPLLRHKIAPIIAHHCSQLRPSLPRVLHPLWSWSLEEPQHFCLELPNQRTCAVASSFRTVREHLLT